MQKNEWHAADGLNKGATGEEQQERSNRREATGEKQHERSNRRGATGEEQQEWSNKVSSIQISNSFPVSNNKEM